MARKGSLSAEALAALGAERLAALLMQLADGDASIRKRLVLAAAEGGGVAALIKALDRRLNALSTSRGFVEWEKSRAYAGEIDGLRRALTDTLAPLDQDAATERLERLVRLAPNVLHRAMDSGDHLSAVFVAAAGDLAAAWARGDGRDPQALARRILALLMEDDYDICETLACDAAPALGDAGLAALTSLVREALSARTPPAAGLVDWGEARLRRALLQVADMQGDVDAFIAAQVEGGGEHVDILGIVLRLLDKGRAPEALEWLERKSGRLPSGPAHAGLPGAPGRPGPDARLDWSREILRIRALDMLARKSEAQDLRWRLFEQTLRPEVLRGYLKGLADFEDDEALERAFALALGHDSALAALDFLISWPNLKLAAALAVRRGAEIDGGYYQVLQPAADALSDKHPQAAVTLYRRMIDSTLEGGASAAYRHAVKNLKACADLAARTDEQAGAMPSHVDYVAGLRQRHGRKVAFWSLLA